MGLTEWVLSDVTTPDANGKYASGRTSVSGPPAYVVDDADHDSVAGDPDRLADRIGAGKIPRGGAFVQPCDRCVRGVLVRAKEPAANERNTDHCRILRRNAIYVHRIVVAPEVLFVASHGDVRTIVPAFERTRARERGNVLDAWYRPLPPIASLQVGRVYVNPSANRDQVSVPTNATSTAAPASPMAVPAITSGTVCRPTMRRETATAAASPSIAAPATG